MVDQVMGPPPDVARCESFQTSAHPAPAPLTNTGGPSKPPVTSPPLRGLLKLQDGFQASSGLSQSTGHLDAFPFCPDLTLTVSHPELTSHLICSQAFQGSPLPLGQDPSPLVQCSGLGLVWDYLLSLLQKPDLFFFSDFSDSAPPPCLH